MKLRFQSALFFTALLLGAMACLTGCATTGIERATKTANSMKTVEGDYIQASLQIDATNTSLEELIKPNQIDMKKAFDAYTVNVKEMLKLGKQLDNHTEKMSAQGNEYFTEWEKQGSTYTNPEIRQLSEQRRVEMRGIYSKIPEASIGVKGSLKSYLTDIGEIQKYLANDLTPPGIEAIRPIAQRAIKDGDDLKDAIKLVINAIDRVKTEMTQGGMNK